VRAVALTLPGRWRPPAAPVSAPVAVPGAPPRRSRELRPEIQALRAVAVAVVVVHHLWPSMLPGGFVGVDVFFAISGFLITSLLLREIDRTGSISLRGFWARRARRILPAALVTLLACAVATMLVVPVSRWEQFLSEITASTLYVQNWQLSEAAVDYFASQDAPSPVQHFWSLSVEEQFYLVWPVLLLLALALARGRARSVRRAAVAIAMGLFTAVSLALAVHLTAANPEAAYFVTPTRAWEFGLGGLLALLPQREESPAALRALLSWAGLVAIAVASATYTAATPFPGLAALLPVLGACAVMRAGAPAHRLAPTPALELRPVQLVGDLSYSIYLWHWPLIVLAPFVLADGLHTDTLLAILMLTILLAWLSKRLIEDPVRAGALLARRPARWTFAAAAAATALVLAVTAQGTSRAEARLADEARLTTAQLAESPRCFGAASRDPETRCENPRLRLRVTPTPAVARDLDNAPCTIIERGPRLNVCEFGTPRSRAVDTIALLGDSHASHWRAAVEVVAKSQRWRGLSMTHTSCPFSTAERNIPQPDRSRCETYRRSLLRWFARHPEVSTVFVSALSGGQGIVPRAGQGQFEGTVRGYLGAWAKLPATVKRIVVIRDNPKAGRNADACVERAMDRDRPAGTACAVPRGSVLDRDAQAVAAARLRRDRAHAVDLTRFFCDARRCYPVIGGALVLKDTTHLTAVFARTLGPYLERPVQRLPQAG
jgi:peptidoglycan/LPS O-acetylase OafA/YrhL